MPHMIFSNIYLEAVVRLLISCVCGAVIGSERTHRNKEAGIRTHIIVAVGATVFVLVSKYGFNMLPDIEGVQVDVARVASNVVTGVSFLGAGIISTRGDAISGLTTAAGIWATAAVGMSIGTGMYVIGVTGTIFILIVQFVLHFGNGYGLDKMMSRRIVVNMEDSPEHISEFKHLLELQNIHITGIRIKRYSNNTLTCSLNVYLPVEVTNEEIYDHMKKCKYIKSIGVR